MSNKTQKLLQKAHNLIPGATQCYSHGATQYTKDILIDKAKGTYIWDVEGKKYLDVSSGGFPSILGYGDVSFARTVYKRILNGNSLSISHPLESEVVELLTKNIPCAEMVRFGRNGHDVCAMAVRASRAYTDKDIILSQGYHGQEDWYIASTERNAGVPKFNKKLIKTFKYNDLERFKKLIKKYKGKIAAVIIEPVQLVPPNKNFLEGIRKLTLKENIVLIFDEIITGFRFPGMSAQKYFKITPDLTCLGKSMGNGIPISALVGKKKIMKVFDFDNKAFFSTTFGGELTGLEAVKYTINILREKNVITHIWKMGSYLKKELKKIIKELELENVISIKGYPCWFHFITKNDYNKSLLQYYLLEEHLMTFPNNGFVLSFAHKMSHIKEIVKMCSNALMRFSVELEFPLKNDLKVIKSVFKRLD